MSGPLARLSDQQRLDWLRLIRSESVGPQTFRALINRYGGAAAALEALPALAAQRGRAISIPDEESCAREIDALAKMGGSFIALGEEAYPARLRAIHGAPPLMAVMGDQSVLARPMLAVIGSRNASAAGLAFTERVVRDVAAAGIVIVSGLARGVDARAHQASLATGTIGVLGGGLDRLYPPEHAQLAREICAHGLLMSEMPLGWEARGRDFPRRNRIVAGLSLGTLVIEASRGSGSLITAKFAAEQGREIFAVPGSPLDPRAEGTNALLREGATLCTRGQDVLDVLLPLMQQEPPRDDLFGERLQAEPGEPLWDELDLIYDGEIPQTMPGLAFNEPDQPPPHNALSPSHPARDMDLLLQHVEALLGPSPVSLDDLARAAGASMGDLRSIVLELELSGRILIHSGGLISLKI